MSRKWTDSFHTGRPIIRSRRKTNFLSPDKFHIDSIMDLLAQTPEKLSAMSRLLSGDQVQRPLRSGESSFMDILANFRCDIDISAAIT